MVRANSNELRPSSASAVALTEIKAVTIRAVVTVQISVGNFISTIGLTRPLDDLADVFGGTMLLELLSAELDSSKLSLVLLLAYIHINIIKSYQRIKDKKIKYSFNL